MSSVVRRVITWYCDCKTWKHQQKAISQDTFTFILQTPPKMPMKANIKITITGRGNLNRMHSQINSGAVLPLPSCSPRRREKRKHTQINSCVSTFTYFPVRPHWDVNHFPEYKSLHNDINNLWPAQDGKGSFPTMVTLGFGDTYIRTYVRTYQLTIRVICSRCVLEQA